LNCCNLAAAEELSVVEKKDGLTDLGEELEIPEELGEVEGVGLNGDPEDTGEEQAITVESLQAELAENRDRMLRIAAESENFKKRMERERSNLVKYAGENILRELLGTVDNLDRALEQATAEGDDVESRLTALIEGIELTRKGLVSNLERFEVVAVDSVGREFNPNEQEAMTMEPSDTVPANHVSQEFMKGYRFKDRLLRAAKVVVSSGPEGK
jgi:molecular chaperone GrpE